MVDVVELSVGLGRNGSIPVTDVEAELTEEPDGGMQLDMEAQVYPFSQHPPPRFTGQA